MNYVHTNAETYAMNLWSDMVWNGTTSTAMAPSASAPNSSAADTWGWSQSASDVAEASSKSPNETGLSTFMSCSLSSSLERRSSSPPSSSSQSSPAHKFDDNPPPSSSPTFNDYFGSEGQLDLQETSNLMSHHGLAKRPFMGTSRANRETTETVAVDSSASVAQIVGKNGCKIKLLRAKYNVYIHTPVAGEEPVFIIKGRREDVHRIKQEILDTARHFNQLRASKVAKIEGIVNASGSVCIRLYIPDRYVGLVVGRSGWFVKVLQARFNVHIETPKFDVRTFFLIYGTEENVQKTLEAIVEHISTKNNNMKLDCRQIGMECYIE